MSAAARQETELTTDEAVEIVWQRVLAGDYHNSYEACRALWHTFTFSSDDLAFLALFGFGALAQRNQALRRVSPGNTRPAVGWGAPHGKKWAKYIALTFPYPAADGSEKPLLYWTTDDLTVLAVRCGKYISRWSERRLWAQETTALLDEHGAARLCDLPPHVLAAVNDGARDVMSRDNG